MENENFDSEDIVQELIKTLSEYEFGDIVAEIEERIKFNFMRIFRHSFKI
ncbi:MAG: hypothetical protein V4511_08530 [Bacteroidota bacterium]